jgi:DNA-binding protein H-NS
MAKPLKELLALRAELDGQIEIATREQKAQAIAQVKTLIAEYGLTMADIQGGGGSSAKGKRAGKSGGKVAVKYRDKSTGDTWTGRGLQPKWLRAALAAGRKLTDFVV